MKGELKAGGLALVYGLSEDVQHWNGRSVTLLERRDDIPDDYSAIWWRCEYSTGMVIHVAPKNLLPIDGDDQFLDSATGEGLNRLAEQFGFKPAELTA